MPKQQGRLPFEYEGTGEDRVTSWAGLPVVAEMLAAFGVLESVKRNIKLGKKAVEFNEATNVSAFVLMMTAGGDCLDDMQPLREDDVLSEMVQFQFPSPETARAFLYAFHDDELIEKASKQVPKGRTAFIPEESQHLKGLGVVGKDLIAAMLKRWPQKRVTIDIDATIHESHKQQAKAHYANGRGYQPMTAYCPELDAVVWDQFRDGNVPAHMHIREAVLGALSQLPDGIESLAVRADSAGYDIQLLRELSERKVHFAIGTDAREAFRSACAAVPAEQWTRLEEREDTYVDVAEVEYQPKDWRSTDPKLRFIVSRLSPLQGDLLAEKKTAESRYFGCVTNREDLTPLELLRWYWAKAGTIEQVHDVVKNDLGGGVLPCGRFGANAAWSRLTMLTYNVLSIIRRLGPERLKTARPKRLRLNLFALPAVLVTHARHCIARMKSALKSAADLTSLRNLAWAPEPAT